MSGSKHRVDKPSTAASASRGVAGRAVRLRQIEQAPTLSFDRTSVRRPTDTRGKSGEKGQAMPHALSHRLLVLVAGCISVLHPPATAHAKPTPAAIDPLTSSSDVAARSRSFYPRFTEWWVSYSRMFGWICQASPEGEAIRGEFSPNFVANGDSHRYIIDNPSSSQVEVTVRYYDDKTEQTQGSVTVVVPAQSTRTAQVSFTVPDSAQPVSTQDLPLMAIAAEVDLHFDAPTAEGEQVRITRRHIASPDAPGGEAQDFSEFDRYIRCLNPDGDGFCTEEDAGGSGGNPGPHRVEVFP